MVGHPNLFALGDVTDIQENKLAYLATKQADLTAKNVSAMVRQGRTAKLSAWIPNGGFTAYMISVGRR